MFLPCKCRDSKLTTLEEGYYPNGDEMKELFTIMGGQVIGACALLEKEARYVVIGGVIMLCSTIAGTTTALPLKI